MAGGSNPVRLIFYNMTLDKITSGIYNDIVAGLSGMNSNPTISLDQLEDEVIETRHTVVKDWYLKGLLKAEDMMSAINCVPVDCADPSKCCNFPSGKTQLHFEIPRLMDDLGEVAINYIGSTDRSTAYDVYFNRDAIKMHSHKRRGADKPYVYIEKTPNANGKYDGWIYNLPFVKRITVIGVFNDPRDLEEYSCCNKQEYLDLGAISNEIKTRLTKTKLQYYRQGLQPPQPNNSAPR